MKFFVHVVIFFFELLHLIISLENLLFIRFAGHSKRTKKHERLLTQSQLLISAYILCEPFLLPFVKTSVKTFEHLQSQSLIFIIAIRFVIIQHHFFVSSLSAKSAFSTKLPFCSTPVVSFFNVCVSCCLFQVTQLQWNYSFCFCFCWANFECCAQFFSHCIEYRVLRLFNI